MDINTFANDLQAAQPLDASTIDLANDLLVVVDVSETRGRMKFKKIKAAELSKAVKNDEAQLLKLALTSGRNPDGSLLGTAASAGKYGFSVTVGTGEKLLGEVATSNTKTDTAIFEAVLPDNFVTGSAVALVVNAQQTGTATVKTIDASAYEVSDAGAHSADLVTTNAQSITTSAAEYSFTIDTTSLVAGDRLLISITSVATEAAAGNTNAQVNSLRLTF